MSDILWFNTSTNAVGIWLMSGTQWLSQPVTLVPVPAGWLISETGDFNGDGMSDILLFNTTTNAAGIWLMNGTQFLSPPVNLGSVPAGWLIQGTNTD
jgi:hypothetical protein